MKFSFPKFALAFAVVVSAACGVASADISYTGSNISENFDSFGTSTVNGVFSATVGTQALIPGTTGFAGTKVAGSGTAATNFTANDGSGNSGGIYNYGTSGAADRALGALASGSNVMAFGFRLVNNSSLTVDSITVAFTQENWRTSTTSLNTLVAGFSFDQTISSSSFLTSGSGFSTVTALDLVGPAPVAANGALDGNLAANQTARSFTFTGLNWTPGQQFFLRWTDFNDFGNDAGLGIDNMNLSFTSAIPEPATAGFALLMVAGIAGIRRRS